jgi:hypothetical protein
MENSCPDKAHQEILANQVQGPLPTTPVHARLERSREGREVKAIATTQYVSQQPLYLHPKEYRLSIKSPSAKV